MEPSKLALFVLATAGLAFLPGPNTALTISRSISQGRLSGVKVLLGIEAGFLVHLTAASTGFTALLLAIPAAYAVMRTAGGVYLLYVAYRIIRTRSEWQIQDSLPRESGGQLIVSGFLSNALNPKAATLTLGAIHILVSSC